MSKTAKAYSVSLNSAIASALERTAFDEGLSPGLMIAEIVEKYFVDSNHSHLAADAKAELLLLRKLRDQAINKMASLKNGDDCAADITLQTFQACQNDPMWLREYE
ncbi:MAG: hypothetical protein JSR79_07930, partial [Proteobacteria bacterium]|nr:hypothetical protein [Pseudomonadota bacterium]